jgi:nicotinamidase-related amidase
MEALVITDMLDESHPGELELVSPKRSYGAFDGTDLDERLRGFRMDEVVLAGQHTHICVRHSAPRSQRPQAGPDGPARLLAGRGPRHRRSA